MVRAEAQLSTISSEFEPRIEKRQRLRNGAPSNPTGVYFSNGRLRGDSFAAAMEATKS